MKKFTTKKGFSLIETLLYISVFSVVVFLIFGVYGIVIESKVRQRTLTEVSEEGSRMMQIMTQTVRNAVSLNAPLPTETGYVLSLYVIDPLKNPTLFYVNDNNLLIAEGGGTPVVLNSNNLSVSNLEFSNLSGSGTNGTVNIKFTLSSNSTNIQKIYQFSQDFESNATVR
jgi:type II secretory pathway pseudopilin PulG